MGQFQLNRSQLEHRLRRAAVLKTIPLPTLLGEVATERFLTELLDELHKKLGTGTNIVLLD